MPPGPCCAGVDLGPLADALLEAKQRGLANLGLIAASEAPNLELDAGFCRRYLTNIIRYDLGERTGRHAAFFRVGKRTVAGIKPRRGVRYSEPRGLCVNSNPRGSEYLTPRRGGPWMNLRIGTRGSPLALWQANHVVDRLRTVVPGIVVELVRIQTEGDEVRDVPLGQMGGVGVFTKAIQNALLERRVAVAVHSLKDLPTLAVQGLVLAAVPERGPIGDVLVSLKHRTFDDLPSGARLATGSLRRRAQVLNRRPDLRLEEIRGNVETRLRKLSELDLDGVVLAQAGLERLGLKNRITEVLNPSWMLPAVGQGALGLECREG